MSSLSRAIELLRLLGHRGSDGAGVNELARILHQPPSSTHRLLRELLRHGLVHQDESSKRYLLGFGLVELAASALDGSTLRKHLHPAMASLSEALSCNCFLTVLHQERCICIDTTGPIDSFHYFAAVGREMPLNASAASKAIAAFQPEADRRRMVERAPMHAYTPRTETDREELLRQLERIAELGYAVCDEDLEPGIRAIAVPIHSRSGGTRASLTAIGPVAQLTDETSIVTALRQVASSVVHTPGSGYSR